MYKSLHGVVTPAESHALQVRGWVSSGLGREAAGAPKMELWFACVSSYSVPSLGGIRKMCKKVLHVTWSPQTGPPSTPSQDGRRRKGLGI